MERRGRLRFRAVEGGIGLERAQRSREAGDSTSHRQPDALDEHLSN